VVKNNKRFQRYKMELA